MRGLTQINAVASRSRKGVTLIAFTNAVSITRVLPVTRSIAP